MLAVDGPAQARRPRHFDSLVVIHSFRISSHVLSPILKPTSAQRVPTNKLRWCNSRANRIRPALGPQLFRAYALRRSHLNRPWTGSSPLIGDWARRCSSVQIAEPRGPGILPGQKGVHLGQDRPITVVHWISKWFLLRRGPPPPAFGHLLSHGGEGLFLQWCRTRTG